MPADPTDRPARVRRCRTSPHSPGASAGLGTLLRIWCVRAAGYFDFATPFFDAELSFRRNGIVPERIELTYYEAGHMMYVHEPSLERFLGDVREFIAGGP